MLLDLLFPRRCLNCGQPGGYFCQVCSKKIQPIGKQICPVCQRPALSGRTHPRCRTKYSLDGLVSIFPYRGAVKKAIAKLKYKFVTDLAEELITLSAKSIRRETKASFGSFKKSFLIPVPLHWRRKRQRGFNQADLLGNLLAEKFGWQLKPNLLIRHRYTQPQMSLKGKERQKNVKGVFKINPRLVKRYSASGNLLVFDDVWTTGSTLKEAGSVLKRAGFPKIWGLTLAR